MTDYLYYYFLGLIISLTIKKTILIKKNFFINFLKLFL